MRLWEDEQPGKGETGKRRDYERSVMSSKDGPSCTWAHSLCCWKPETHGWFRAAPAIVIAFSSRSPLSKRRIHRVSFTLEMRRTDNQDYSANRALLEAVTVR